MLRTVILGLLLTSCQHAPRIIKDPGVPEYSVAWDLRGQNPEQVQAKLGPPSDQMAGRYFWILTEDSKYHPEPKTELYEFFFYQGKLAKITKALK